MARTIYEATPGALTATGDRTVATFPSGLCRVDQTYACPSSYAATHRATLAIGSAPPDSNTAPAIDGLYIFPAPEEIQKPDGFTEFRVSAYGRTATGAQNVFLQQEDKKTEFVSYKVWKVSCEIVVRQGEFVDVNSLGLEDYLEAFDFSITPGAIISSTGGIYEIRRVDLVWSDLRGILYNVTYGIIGITEPWNQDIFVHYPKIIISTSRSFGEFVEVEITTEREAAAAPSKSGEGGGEV